MKTMIDIRRMVLPAAAALAMFAVAACVNINGEEQLPNQGEVSFGVEAAYQADVRTRSEEGGSIATRTEYSGKDENGRDVQSSSSYERINWLSTDGVVILCQQADGNKTANFGVTPGTASGNETNATIEPWDHKLYWGNGTHYFFGLYPSPLMDGCPSGTSIATSGTEGKAVTIHGTIPTTQTVTVSGNELKPDMAYAYMYAATTASSGNVKLHFKPLVTTLRFTLTSENAFPSGLTLKKIVLSSEQSGSYLAGSFDATVTSNGLTALTSGNITSGTNSITINVPSGVQLKTDDPLMFTILTLPVDQTKMKLTLTFSDGSTKTLSLKSSGTDIIVHACKKCYINDVNLPWQYVFVVEGGFTTTYVGGSDTYKVTSYKQISSGTNTTKIPVPWEAYQYRVREGGATSYGSWSANKPVWLSTFTTSGTPTNANPQTLNVAIAPSDRSGVAIDALTNATARGSQSNPWDLSTHNLTGGSISKTTANCYVVSAPGWYKFPLAYGNAYKNGSANTDSYAPTKSTAARYLTPFAKHSGTISSPDIASVNRAELLWQDAKNLITVADISINNGYVVFHIEKANICEGNAVIAAKASGGTILWSWHIWVTPYTGTVTLRGQTFQARNLGWCDGGEITWPKRWAQVRFRQVEGSEEIKTLTFTQSGNTETVMGGGPHYQWGRKDPLIPPIGIPDATEFAANKIWYNAAGVASQDVPISNGQPKNPQYGILHPMEMIWLDRYHLPGYKNGASYNPYTDATGGWPFSDWIGNSSTYYGSSHYCNLWNYNATADDKVNEMLTVKTFASLTHGKTVYDPCPIGYTIPTPTELAKLATTTEQMGGTDYRGTGTITWNATQHGWVTNGNLIPANGMRFYLANNPHVGNVGTYGYYFSSAYCNMHNGLALIFNSSDLHMTASFAKGSGRSIRCVPE